MLTWIRRTHMLMGLALAGLLAMYTVTGAVMVWGRRWNSPVTGSVQARPLPDSWRRAQGDGNPDSAAALARDHYGLAGRVDEARREPEGRWHVIARRPGLRSEIRLDSRNGTATIALQRDGWARTLAQLHQFFGYRGHPRHIVWAVAVDACALALIIFAASGVYLWWRLKRDAIGGLVLAGSTLYAVASFAWLALGP